MKQQFTQAEPLGQFRDIPNQNQANEAPKGSFTMLCTHKSYKWPCLLFHITMQASGIVTVFVVS